MGEGGACRLGTILVQLGAGGEEGIVGWALRGVAGGRLDGLATIVSAAPQRAAGPAQPNGVVGVDHVVVATPDLARTLAAFADVGLTPRRVRDAGPVGRQAFFVIGDALAEVVGPAQPAGDGPATFWGLTLVVADLDAACASLGERIGPPREAIQPGRRIATLTAAAGLTTRLALMTPRAGR